MNFSTLTKHQSVSTNHILRKILKLFFAEGMYVDQYYVVHARPAAEYNHTSIVILMFNIKAFCSV